MASQLFSSPFIYHYFSITYLSHVLHSWNYGWLYSMNHWGTYCRSLLGGRCLCGYFWCLVSTGSHLEKLLWNLQEFLSRKPSWIPFKEFRNGSEGVWSVSCDFVKKLTAIGSAINAASREQCAHRRDICPNSPFGTHGRRDIPILFSTYWFPLIGFYSWLTRIFSRDDGMWRPYK